MRHASMVFICAAGITAAACTIAACGGEPADVAGVPPGEIIGRVETSADIPASGCRVLLEGSPLGAICDVSGGFDIRSVPPGRWDLRIVSDDPLSLPGKRLVVGANRGFVTDLGPIRLAQPGSIGGRVLGGGDLGGVIVALPAYGVVTTPNANRGYLLIGAPPGRHDVVAIAADGTVVRAGVDVAPDRTTIGVDFDLAATVGDLGPIQGRAVRDGRGEDGHRGLTVELVDAVSGEVEASVTTGDDGNFSLDATPGVFAVRARDGANPITAIIPSVVPHSALPLRMPVPLVVLAQGGDLDGDGTPDADDPDIDDDGVANDADAFPYDPAETRDVDGDGLGDRADLATQGPGVDTHNPTPDTDGDGHLDFEDVCPDDADPAQADGDGDGDGDVCDNCPSVPNDDQEDSVGNGVGDACRFCEGSEDCPDDLICHQGHCVGCVTSSQCGDQVCFDGSCVDCSATLSCGGERVCNVPIGVCQECLVNVDCDAGEACVAGRCLAQCMFDTDCAGAFCIGGACVACRDNADCASTQWCDAGLCAPACTSDASCTGGRVCDVPTRTCILPCSATCPSGQTCDAGGLCRQACDLSFPCPGNLECDPVEMVCVAQCEFDTDCGTFEACQLGQCVASGACGYDTDCGPAEICGPLLTCVARTTAFDPPAGAYLCTSACQCKLGETCAGGHCVPDGVPTRYVSVTASGTGLTPDGAMADLAAAIGGRLPGEVVALRGGQTHPTGGAAIELPAGVRVQGGYLACSPRRWVRDSADLTTSRVRHTGGVGMFTVPGTLTSPRAGVVLRSLTLEEELPSVNGTMIDAVFAPGLTLTDLTFELDPPAAGAATGVHVVNSLGVTLTGMRLPLLSGNFTFTLVDVDRSSGLVRNAAITTVSEAFSVFGVRVRSAAGPVTVDAPTTGTWAVGSSSYGVLIEDTPVQPVTVTGGRFGWVTGRTVFNDSGAIVGAVRAYRSGAVTIADSIVDGTGFLDPFLSEVQNFHVGYWFEDASGTLSGNQVIFPPERGAVYTIGYLVDGPDGEIVLDDNATSGMGGHRHVQVWIRDVTGGVVRLVGGTYTTSAVPFASLSTQGLVVENAPVVATDATLQVPGQATTAVGFYLSGLTTVARIERCRFRVDGDLTTTTTAHGGQITASASLELYDSWLRVRAASTDCMGLRTQNATRLRIIGNTIDGGGIGPQSVSTALYCDGTTSLNLFSSNLFDAGDATATNVVAGGRCGDADVFDHNYFVRGGAIGSDENVAALATAATGVPDAEGDINGGTTGCFDLAFPQPDPRIAAGSPCVNRGIVGTRLDGSTRVTDLLGGPRVRGLAADIGAHEVQ